MKHLLLVAALFLGLVSLGCLPISEPDGWGAAAVAGDEVFVATRDGRIVAVTAGSSSERIVYPVNPDQTIGPVYADLLIDGGRLYAGSFNGTLVALDLGTGQPAAERTLEDPVVGDPVRTRDGLLVPTAGSDAGRLLSLEPASLQAAWERVIATGPIWAAVVVDGGTGYVAALDRRIYAIDLATGDERWRFEGGSGFAATPVLSAGTLYTGSLGRSFFAIDAVSGEERWRFDGASNFFWGRPLVRNGVVYTAAIDGTVYALDATTGEPVWPEPYLAGADVLTDLVEVGGRLVVGTDSGRVIAVDFETGAEQWAAVLPEGTRVRATPQLVDGVLYVTGMRERRIVIATVDPATGAVSWTYQVAAS